MILRQEDTKLQTLEARWICSHCHLQRLCGGKCYKSSVQIFFHSHSDDCTESTKETADVVRIWDRWKTIDHQLVISGGFVVLRIVSANKRMAFRFTKI